MDDNEGKTLIILKNEIVNGIDRREGVGPERERLMLKGNVEEQKVEDPYACPHTKPESRDYSVSLQNTFLQFSHVHFFFPSFIYSFIYLILSSFLFFLKKYPFSHIYLLISFSMM